MYPMTHQYEAGAEAVTEPDDLDILHACISISITLESPITLRLEVPAPIIH